MTEHQPMTAAERLLADELAAQIKVLLAGKSLAHCVAILTALNNTMAAGQDEAAAEPVRVH